MKTKKRDVLSPSGIPNKLKICITVFVALAVIVLIAILIFFLVDRKLNEVNLLFEEGNICFEERDYDQAEKYYKDVIALEPEHAQAYLGLGNTYLNRADMESAVAVWEAGYKKTEDADILKMLKKYRKSDNTDEKENRSVLDMNETQSTEEKVQKISLEIGLKTHENPGSTVENKTTVPSIAPEEIEAIRKAGEKEENAGGGSEKAEGNASGGDAAGGGETDIAPQVTVQPTEATDAVEQTEQTVTEPVTSETVITSVSEEIVTTVTEITEITETTEMSSETAVVTQQ
ncbi:MAG: tetratricopeptide repeat protein [Oscillospiraceae bacterium]|nr:tetratricopeptide repeat protein [Oscillospiraceae bacterium]